MDEPHDPEPRDPESRDPESTGWRSSPVRVEAASEIVTLAGVLGRAFYDDPIMVHLFPSSRARLAKATIAMTGEVHSYLERGEVWRRGPAVALWLPPLDGPRPAPARPTVAALWRSWRFLGRRLPHARRLAALMEQAHPHDPPHWYLRIIGTDPDARGQGHASALLASMIDRLDADGLPSYLESSNIANLPLYRRFGYAELATIEVPGGPTLWPMWREPR
jgi:ribosomal protein S18 acetylase RimI-like enzyme